MENSTERKCHYCDEPARPDSNFCSQWCFELWYSLQQAAVLAKAFDKIFGEVDANTRPS